MDWGNQAMLKRAFDLVAGTVLFVLVLPLVVLLALAVALMFRAWPFFTQDRVGLGGRRFKMVKLRTLPPSAPSDADKFQIREVVVPSLARFLRRTHLDELPQLLLVPLGRMSLVGPRPEMLRLHAAGDLTFATARVSVRPGCAGLWQISEHADLLIWDAPDYDLFYIEQSSLRLDLWILWRTMLGIAGLVRPVRLSDVPLWAYRSPAEASRAMATVAPIRLDLTLPAGGGAHLVPAAESVESA